MQTNNVVVTKKADNDLGEIIVYIADVLSAPETASKLVASLCVSMRSLSITPFRCSLARDSYLARQGFRVLIVDNYIVFYVVDESAKQVIIHRVIYAKRNYMRLLKNDD